MAKIAKESAADDNEFPLSLTEFCTRLSSIDRRVELIGAFNSEEANAGRSTDVESAYTERFAQFINRPA